MRDFEAFITTRCFQTRLCPPRIPRQRSCSCFSTLTAAGLGHYRLQMETKFLVLEGPDLTVRKEGGKKNVVTGILHKANPAQAGSYKNHGTAWPQQIGQHKAQCGGFQAAMVKFILHWWEQSCSSWGTSWCLQLNGEQRRQELFPTAGCFTLQKGMFAAESFPGLVVAISYSHAGFKKGKRTQTTLKTHPSC